VTNAELAILSLVAETPRHGYDIERAIQQRGMREWTDIGFSSIYYLLGKLERAGLLEARPGEPGERGPSRKVYSPTPAGFEAWRAASAEALSVPATRSPFALGLANLGGLSRDEAVAALCERRWQLEERRAGMRAKRDSQGPLAWFVDELFDFSETMLDTEIAWVDGLLGRMEAARGDEDRGQAQGE
jgi:DNA-binding PadR family transcriptional regulator